MATDTTSIAEQWLRLAEICGVAPSSIDATRGSLTFQSAILQASQQTPSVRKLLADAGPALQAGGYVWQNHRSGALHLAILGAVNNSLWCHNTQSDPIQFSPITYDVTQNDQWKVGRELGFGAFGTVQEYSGRGRAIAVKRLFVSSSVEAATMENLNNVHVVRYLGTFSSPGKNLIYMELVEGGTLAELAKTISLGGPEARCLLCQVFQGLTYLHSNKLVHRDIKAANTLITLDGCVKIGDLGLTRQVASEEMSHPGTLAWMPPEFIEGSNYTSKADVWSAGILAVELLKGENPWAAEKGITPLLNKILRGDTGSLLSDLRTSEGKKWIESVLQREDARPTSSQCLEVLNGSTW